VNEKQVSIRLPKELLDRAERVADRLESLGVKRAAVLRLAIERGISVLEKEFKKP